MQRELAKPIQLELLTIVSTFIFVIYLLGLSFTLAEEIRFSLPGFIAAGCGVALISFAIGRLRAFRKLNYSNQNILELQKDFHSIQIKRLQTGKLELLFWHSSSYAHVAYNFIYWF